MTMNEKIALILFKFAIGSGDNATLGSGDKVTLYMLLLWITDVRDAMVAAGLIDIDQSKRKVYFTARGQQLTDDILERSKELVAKATTPEVGDLVLVAPDNITAKVVEIGTALYELRADERQFLVRPDKLTLISRADAEGQKP